MQGFQYYIKTEVVFGANSTEQTAQLVMKHGGHRCLVVYGGGSAVRSGLLGRICAQLEERGIAYETLGGVQPNPRVALAREGVKQAIAMDADLILAVGGGSVIDTAKAIAHGTANPEIDIWEFWMRRATVTKSLPVGVVLTIPAAGSETSDSAVLTNQEEGIKTGLGTDFNRPAFAVMDPALAATLPVYQVACGVTDILMHTLDRYFNPVSDNEITDAIAEALLRITMENGLKILDNPADLHAMSEVMWCGSLSHNGLTGLGGQKDFSTHQLGHALSAIYDVAHGASLASVWPTYARYIAPTDNYARFARFARLVWNVDEEDDRLAAEAGIAKQEEYFRKLGMPVRLEELGFGQLDDAALERLADLCSYNASRTIGTFRKLDRNDMLAIYTAANKV